MDTAEAQLVLEQELETYSRQPYCKLVELVGRNVHNDRASPSGTVYQIDVQVFWDDKSKGTIRVIGAIDDRSLRYSILPLSQDFIMAPDGSLVG